MIEKNFKNTRQEFIIIDYGSLKIFTQFKTVTIWCKRKRNYMKEIQVKNLQ